MNCEDVLLYKHTQTQKQLVLRQHVNPGRRRTHVFEIPVLMFDVRTSRVLAELAHAGKIFAVCCLDGLHTPPKRERAREALSTHKYWELWKNTTQTNLSTALNFLICECLCVVVRSVENNTVHLHVLHLVTLSY